MPRATSRTPSPGAPGDLSTWGRVWRYLAAVGIGLLAWVLTYPEVSSSTTPPRLLMWQVDPLLGLGALVLMGWRRRWPVPIAVATTALSAVSVTSAGAWAVAVVSLSTRRRWAEVLPVASASVLATVAYEHAVSAAPLSPLVATVVGVLSVSLLVAVGFYVGARRDLVAHLLERAETAEREQALRAARARIAERARIAQEMHDVIAHRMSLVAMHAGALAFRDDLTAEQTRAAAEVIRDGAHQALDELRGVLGVLRDRPAGATNGATPSASPDPPQPSLDDVPALLDEARSAGDQVHLEMDVPEGRRPPQTVGRTAYRIIQEALTNARKHAAGEAASVFVGGDAASGLRIEVSNPLPRGSVAARAGLPGSGVGLVGLAERAAALDGTLEHAVRDGRFEVRAWLPWPT